MVCENRIPVGGETVARSLEPAVPPGVARPDWREMASLRRSDQ